MRPAFCAITVSLVVVVAVAIFAMRDRHIPSVRHARVDALIDAGDYEGAEVLARRQLVETRAARGTTTLEYATAADVLVRALDMNGKAAVDETLDLADENVRRKRGSHPLRADLLATGLVNLGQVLAHRGQYPRSIGLLKEAVAIREQTLGPDHRETAIALDALGLVYTQARLYGSALPILQRSLRIAERDAPFGDDRTARTLEAIAAALQRKGDYREARAPLDRALAIRARTLEPRATQVSTFNLLALQLWFEGQLTDSKAASQRALTIAGRTLRPDHPEVADTLRVLSGTLADLGEMPEARVQATRALAIAEKSLGARHPELAAFWNDLADVNLSTGAYSDAREQFARALQLAEATLGPEHEWIPTVIHNLALVDASLGDFDRARREQVRATRLWERTLGPDHPFVAASLGELAEVMREQGAVEEALPLLQRALSIRERSLGPSHPDTARTLADLAATLSQLGDLDGAQRMADRALRIWERTDASDAPELATVLELYGKLQLSRGAPAQARHYLARALSIREKALGASHPLVADVMVSLADVQASLGRERDALETAIHAENIGRGHLRLMLRHLPERESLNYAASRPRGLDLILSLAKGPHASTMALDALIQSRALVLDEMAARHHLAESDEGDVAELRKALSTARQRLANVVVRGPRGASPERYLALVEDARLAREDAERALAERSAAFRTELMQAQAGFSEVQSAIPPGGVLVSYVRFNRRSGARGAALVSRKGPANAALPFYVAFVTHSRGAPVAVPLSSAATIESRVARWRSAIHDAALAPSGNDGQRVRSAGLGLRAAIWDPLTPLFAGAGTVFVVPDAALNLVPFDALPGRTQEFLIEETDGIHYVSSERDLLLTHQRSDAHGLLAVGGPTFDGVISTSVPKPPAGEGAVTALKRSAESPCPELENLRFPPLAGTLEEVRDIARLWSTAALNPSENTRVLTAREADETTFKREAPGRRVLHLATHGFFLKGPCIEERPGLRSVGGIVSSSNGKPLSGNVVRTRVEYPLMLSGLALAGANGQEMRGADEDDGILTAEEVAAMDLDGVEWAVLSACDTGVGELRAGEGVLGLRRSFEIAGARTVIMSLWPVEDEAARAWMIALYEGRLKRHLSTIAATRQASLAMLNARRARGQNTDPFFWAAFVAAGDWH